MQILILLFGILVFILLGISFYNRQNRGNLIGGNISKPKATWLFYCLFVYFFLSVYTYYCASESSFSSIVLSLIVLLYSRAAVQAYVMYVSKAWHPIYGMAFNVLVATILLGWSVLHISKERVTFTDFDYINVAYIFLAFATLVIDTYYAYSFHKLVGEKTKGDSAIWFAVDRDELFKKINKTTYYLNIVFLIYLGVYLIKFLTF